ncbi:hypothetical protein [Kamptonema formosum]|uniref:hypothetical protein n=1 Tax=Kamptonema formosum TaxID=331992 RepID=UPI000373FFD8|nr:hypothetical protein [Oscillatoria sp. PCC 10802]
MMRNRILASLLIAGTSLTLTGPTGASLPQKAKLHAPAAGIETFQPAFLAQRSSRNSIEGSWKISEGKAPNGDRYTGTADIQAISRSSDANLYSVSWNTSEGEFSGLAFLEDDRLFVGWAPQGKTYGVAVYRINSDGTLDGKWTYSGGRGQIGEETATGGRSGRVEGNYEVKGRDSGGEYNGSLRIRRSDDTYELTWTVDRTTYRGVGLRSGDWLAVGWGPQDDFGVTDYRIRDSEANGRWAIPGESDLGVDNLTRQRRN